MDDGDSMWSRKGATQSDTSARQEFGLTQQEIIAAIRVGKLQFRESNMHGNPWYRLPDRAAPRVALLPPSHSGFHDYTVRRVVAGGHVEADGPVFGSRIGRTRLQQD